MAKQIINIGSDPNDRTGDPIRVAFDKTNQNFTELYNSKTKQTIFIACSDETTPITVGTNKVIFRMTYGFVLSGVRASLTTAQTSGNLFTVDIRQNGISILSTKLSIDNTQKSSVTSSIQAVINTAILTDDSEISINVDQIGNGTATGLKVYLIGDIV
jgi:hypothetical protein